MIKTILITLFASSLSMSVFAGGISGNQETGDPERIPRKHTVIVQPGSRADYLVTADAMGPWAFHCHLIFHMLGMFRKVVVS